METSCKPCEKSDVWSIGVLMYFLLTGKLLFDGRNEEEIKIAIKSGKIDLY